MATLYINNKPLDVGDNHSPMLQSCDACDQWKSVTGGRTIYLTGETDEARGEAVAWFCLECLRR